jgi:hypothetical protein
LKCYLLFPTMRLFIMSLQLFFITESSATMFALK